MTSYYGLGHGIMIRDGAHDNRIDGAYLHDAVAALSWTDSPETGSGSGYDNIIVNSVLADVRWFNYMSRPSTGVPEIAGNLFANNTYFNASSSGTLFGADSAIVRRLRPGSTAILLPAARRLQRDQPHRNRPRRTAR